jgi:hypothetical protein
MDPPLEPHPLFLFSPQINFLSFSRSLFSWPRSTSLFSFIPPFFGLDPVPPTRLSLAFTFNMRSSIVAIAALAVVVARANPLELDLPLGVADVSAGLVRFPLTDHSLADFY